jgi:sigma-B regulation protein RsbU (phosphoserine phosphatase)
MKPSAQTKVLIVDDDPFFQRILHKRLSTEGYQVMTAVDGREGMKAIVTYEPDLVISDWMMPEVDGLELCQSIKTGLGESAPYFILLTAKGEINDRLLGLETGADDYLVKPCDQGELMARIRAGMRIVSLSQELRRTVAELRTALDELELARAALPQVHDGVPVCTHCKRVCGDDGVWRDAVEVLATQTGAVLGRGLCPDCLNVKTAPASELIIDP